MGQQNSQCMRSAHALGDRGDYALFDGQLRHHHRRCAGKLRFLEQS